MVRAEAKFSDQDSEVVGGGNDGWFNGGVS